MLLLLFAAATEEITGIVDLSLWPRTFTVTVIIRSNGLTLGTRSLELTLPGRP
ncbi:MAG: hypothetical protein KA314_04465 [Chloroflexi bacterium]|nr:hypothetical protein [Chloroflexota bacterium]